MDTQKDEIVSSREEALLGLVKDLGISNLSKEKQDELVIEMTEVLLKRIFLETMEKLGEQGREEYEKMSEGEIQSEQVEEFFREKIKNYDEMVKKIIEEFKVEMMDANR